MNIDKEIEFNNGIKYLINKYGEKTVMKWYWKPQSYSNGLPVINKQNIIINKEFENDVKNIIDNINKQKKYTIEDKNIFLNDVDNLINKLNFKFDNNISQDIKQLQKFALYRYNSIGALSNISLSVSPKLKKNGK